MIQYITANQAREIMPSIKVEIILNELMVEISEAAKSDSSRLYVREYGFGDGALYSSKVPSLQNQIITKLRELGYTAEIRIEEKQFVDIYLLITWE